MLPDKADTSAQSFNVDHKLHTEFSKVFKKDGKNCVQSDASNS